MTIGQIANQVARFHGKERSECVDEVGNDLVITALNEAKLELDKEHDFLLQQAQAWLSVDPTSGALLSAAKLFDGTPPDVGDAAVKVKSVEGTYLYEASTTPVTLIPLYADPKKLLAIKTKERSYRYGSARYPGHYNYNNYPFTRYPGTTSDNYYQRALRVYFHGDKVQFDPVFDASKYLIIDGSIWLADYSADEVVVSAASESNTTLTLESAAPASFGVGVKILGTTVASGSGTSWVLAANASETITFSKKVHYTVKHNVAGAVREQYTDWFVDRAGDYLKWHAICSLNFLYNTYLARSETFQAPPEKMRETAKQALLEWDTFLWESGRQPNAIR